MNLQVAEAHTGAMDLARISHIPVLLAETLADLPYYEGCVEASAKLSEVMVIFNQNEQLPGIAVRCDDGDLTLISRWTCSDLLSKRFYPELFLEKPVKAFVETVLLPETLQLHESTELSIAARACLSRPHLSIHEPLVVLRDDGECRIVDIYDLLKGIMQRLSKALHTIDTQLAEKERIQNELIAASRLAGMAEVATGVLHNVGNVLNSINVSAHLLLENLQGSRVETLSRAAEVIGQHQSDLVSFLTEDTRGQAFPRLLDGLASNLSSERDRQIDEVRSLVAHVDHIREIVNMQQTHAKARGTMNLENAVELVEAALKINDESLTRHRVKVVRKFETNGPFVTERHKVLQILVNLISNAKNALSECDQEEKVLKVLVDADAQNVRICVCDNGPGIPRENLAKIFGHGFTTRKDGHGFGLHSAALAAQELGGALSARSDGLGTGSEFELVLPLKCRG